MNAFARFLAFLAGILGDDHALLAAVRDAEPVEPDTLDLGDDHGLTDDQVDVLAGLYNVDTETVDEIADALVTAAQDPDLEIGTVAEIADNVDGLRWVADVRAEVETAEAEQREALLSRLAPAATSEDDEDADEDADAGDGADASTEDSTDASTEDNENEGAEDDEPVAVTAAARPRIGNVAARRSRGGETLRRTLEDRQAQAAAAWQLRDTIGTHGIGAHLTDDEFVAALAVRIDEIAAVAGPGHGDGVKHPIATLSLESQYGEDRDLRRMGPAEKATYIEGYVRDALESVRTAANPVAALTASGGLCTPREPQYDIPTLATAVRPVADFLASFLAGRGGITYRPGRSISTLGGVNTNDSGIAVQTRAKDEQGVNKPRYRVPCPSTEDADVYAIPARLIHGNFLERFDPEAVAVAVTLQAALWARVAETELLNRIDAASDDVQTQAQNTSSIGFARAYMNNLDALATGIRSRERSGMTTVLDHLAPFWMLSAMRSDLALELPGSADERLAMADSALDAFFAVRNIRTGWFIDQQVMGTQVDEGNVVNYPAEVVSYIFEPGHHVRLDGGTLTLGVYRDSALNEENDAETFMEGFEGLAPRGVVSYALHSDVCVTGATSAAVDVNCGLVS